MAEQDDVRAVRVTEDMGRARLSVVSIAEIERLKNQARYEYQWYLQLLKGRRQIERIKAQANLA